MTVTQTTTVCECVPYPSEMFLSFGGNFHWNANGIIGTFHVMLVLLSSEWHLKYSSQVLTKCIIDSYVKVHAECDAMLK